MNRDLKEKESSQYKTNVLLKDIQKRDCLFVYYKELIKSKYSVELEQANEKFGLWLASKDFNKGKIDDLKKDLQRFIVNNSSLKNSALALKKAHKFYDKESAVKRAIATDSHFNFAANHDLACNFIQKNSSNTKQND